MDQSAVEAASAAGAAAAAASKITYTGSLAAFGSWLVSSEAGVVFGLVIGLAGLLVQWYYRHREFRIKQKEHDARMAAGGFYGSGDR